MFESALGRYEAASSRPWTGAFLSFGAHAIVAVGVLVFAGRKPPEKPPEEKDLVIQLAPPPLKGSPGGPPKTAQPQAPKPHRAKPKNIPILTKEPLPEPTRAPLDQPAAAPTSETEGPGNGGDPNGSDDGVPGGTGPVVPGPPPPPPPPEPQPENRTYVFSADMQRPALIAGPSQPEYPSNAKAAHIEGTVIARCVITTEGHAQNCTIIKGNPFLNPSVESALQRQRYRPALLNGKPVSVQYTLTFTFKLQ